MTLYIDRILLLIKDCERKTLYRHILFFTLTLIIVCMYGYYFGTYDQVIHIPFLKKIANPALFPGDHFFDLRYKHYSLFWYGLIPFYKAGILEVSMFVIHLITVYLTFWAIWRLTQTLFQNALSSFLAVIAMMMPHLGFSGFPFFEFSLLNRSFALPFELIALQWYLENKTTRAVLLLGVMFNLHAISVNFLMAMILFDMVLRVREYGVRRIIKTLLVFVVGALPVIIWKLSQSGAGLAANHEWFDIINRAVFAHVFQFFNLHNPHVILLTFGGISTLILFFIFVRDRGRIFQNKEPSVIRKNARLHESMTHFIFAGIIILCIQLIASHLAPSAILVAAQITRVGVFITLFCYLYGADYIARRSSQDAPHKIILLTLGLILSYTPLIFLLALFFYKKVTRPVVIWLVTSVMVLILAVTTVFSYHFDVWRPGIHIYPEDNPFNTVQIWAKNNTPVDAIFLTPPDLYWLYDTEWRVLSERSTVATFSELNEAAFEPEYIGYWKPRFEDVAPGALAQFKGNYLDNIQITRSAFQGLNTAQLLFVAHKYHASYIVIEKPYTYDLPVVYENEQFRVYSVK